MATPSVASHVDLLHRNPTDANPQLERETTRCLTCGLVQYRTRTGNCRCCHHALTPKTIFVLPELPPQTPDKNNVRGPNLEIVQNVGQRILQLREARGITQSQLQARCRVSRSYLSRIEGGRMTPSLATLEKIAVALGIGLNRFFLLETCNEDLIEDPFIQSLRPFLRQLDLPSRQRVIDRLRAIEEDVATPTPHASPQDRSLARRESIRYAERR
ncbi:MAG TPA: helix-turn-helix domain-containing protein [Candidatus Paceibacterota bacterium]|jgi:transcriptional regulator with XRE-family HTH domain|nr:helix-turn-helix domain-containing protein [Candidatus Paceibacterota bacterium]